MRRLLYILLFCTAWQTMQAQPYNNEWIDYSKTYYKFKIGKTGLYRIPQQTLVLNNLGNIPAEQFQLWRNGVEVSLYTSVVSGIIPANGYIEFWGEKNDGKPDKVLYKKPIFQVSDALSLETDTASFFLTVNNTGNNARINDALNDIANNTLQPDPYFIYHYRNNYAVQANLGRAVYFGENVYSSSYDLGEFLASHDIATNAKMQLNAGNLYAATGGPDPKFSVAVAGNSYLGYDRIFKADVNGSVLINQPFTGFNAGILNNSSPVPFSSISTASTIFTFTITAKEINDRVAIGFADLEYARQFNFGGQQNFEFVLPATGTGNYFEISNFNSGSVIPMLYDLSTGKRYAANTAVAGLLRFALPASGIERKLVLASEDASNITTVNSFIQRNFINYAVANLQGDYLIISNKLLYGEGNFVEKYREYRSSTPGGNYNAKVYDIDELADQFAFGIKKHPLSVKNFLRYARSSFAPKPKFVFLIGKAVTYNQYRFNESSKYDELLNLVPTFGWPASDNLLASDDLEPLPGTPVGRLAVIRPSEIENYLEKVKTYELAQKSTIQTIAEKAWMKTNVHITGANDPGIEPALTNYLNGYRDTISKPSFGANVFSFNRATTGPETPQTNALMQKFFHDGISIINYFGHSAAISLDYNLNSPDQFDNYGKYPVFIVNGCNAGNIFSFDTARFQVISSLSENFVLAKDRGTIAFIASTHFGVPNYLDLLNQGFYQSLSNSGYGKPLGINVSAALQKTLAGRFDSTTQHLHAEENLLHGDPAIIINAHAKPDFVIEDPQVIINPTFISVAQQTFDIKVYYHNIGKAVDDSVSILINRQYPNGNITTLVSKKIPSVTFRDSVLLTVPIDPLKDIGENKLIVSIDNLFEYDELSELNNNVTKSFFIYEDELKPIYPYNFSIVTRNNIKLTASTANPLVSARQYTMEIDTTELFNSSLKSIQTVTAPGGIVEFNPGIAFTDSTVYYWRVSPVPANGQYTWNTNSFVYLPGSSFGYNQSHLYQHLKSSFERIQLDSFNRKWNYVPKLSAFSLINAVFPVSGTEAADFQIMINGQTITASACIGRSIIFNVFDPISLKPFYNQALPSLIPSGTYGGFMGSAGTCNNASTSGTQYNFEFHYYDTTSRRKMRDFMDWVPNGYIVTSRIILNEPYSESFVDNWKADQLKYGVGNTFYDRMKTAGFAAIDDLTYPRSWVFVYKKNIPEFSPQYKVSDGLNDKIILSLNISSPDTLGYITSPSFGPAAAWSQVKWRGTSQDMTHGDQPTVDIIGISAGGLETKLFTLNPTQQDFDISQVSVQAFPYMKLRMRNADSIHLTPYQLRYWRILYTPVPEGALAPNILYSFKDSLDVGESSLFRVAFKNISDVPFADSISVDMKVTDAANVTSSLSVPKLKKIQPGDTAVISYNFESRNFSGKNNLFLEVNPENDQPEQYHFNNILYKDFGVQTDNYKPILDVTFDGVHILNNDIVSSLPHVLIQLKDDARYLLLDDTSAFRVQLQYPDGSLRNYYFTNTDTLRFTPATPGAENTAKVDFTPYLLEDGTYILYVYGKDKSDNVAGGTEYSVSFQVYNKPMISNLFNYPNPFTTSTAFVFTMTGSTIPQNIRIQILTITGKIVKEITKQELGPLHLGRNITEYKWDGTDMYGQKLANGIYLYRVLTNLNGASLEKFPSVDHSGGEVDTDKYFNKGYGKMYLMR